MDPRKVVLRHSLRASHGHAMKGAAAGVWKLQQRVCVFPQVGGGGLLPEAVEEGAGRIR